MESTIQEFQGDGLRSQFPGLEGIVLSWRLLPDDTLLLTLVA